MNAATQTTPGGNTLFSWVMLIAIYIIAVALTMLAVHNKPHPFKVAGPVGTIQAVTLINGEVFYGTLRSEDDGVLVLTDVYDVQTSVNPQTNQRTIQLNRRRTADWHGPLDMAVPAERVLFTESVGKDSRVAKAIAQANAPATTLPQPSSTPTPEATP